MLVQAAVGSADGILLPPRTPPPTQLPLKLFDSSQQLTETQFYYPAPPPRPGRPDKPYAITLHV